MTTKKESTAGKMPQRLMKAARSAGVAAIFESIVIGVLGLLLILHPVGVIRVIFYVVGIFLCVKGVYRIVNYFAVHGKYDFYNNDLLYGIIALVFGVLAVVLWEQLGGAVALVAGAWTIYGALVRMNTAIKMHAAGIKQWFYATLLSLAMLALGIYMILSLGSVISIVGWIMLAAAVVGILDDVVFMKHIDVLYQQKGR